MTTVRSSSTSLRCLIYKGNSSFADCTTQLHFCVDGAKKLVQLLRKRPHICHMGSIQVDGSISFTMNYVIGSGPMSDSDREKFTENALHTLATASQQFLRAWGEVSVKKAPLIGYVVRFGSTIHLIVECEPGTTLATKDTSADALVFFYGPGNGLTISNHQTKVPVKNRLFAADLDVLSREGLDGQPLVMVTRDC